MCNFTSHIYNIGNQLHTYHSWQRRWLKTISETAAALYMQQVIDCHVKITNLRKYTSNNATLKINIAATAENNELF